MRDTVIVENLQKPACVVVSEEFVVHARNIARVEGHPDLRQLVLPYPLEGLPEARLREIAVGSYPRFLEVIGAVR